MEKIEKQAIQYVAQVTDSMCACNIAEEDRSEPTYQTHNGVIYLDFKVYDLDLETNKSLWGLLASTCKEVTTIVYKATNKYRGCVRYELTINTNI